ncbi:Trypanosome variant surface glycoprotein (A-type), putative [Trypanosoma equiperdum]|uniref:Trypanosome variant surface glycoprotein (A-type), putative n=1 Tax=Trypanosoma equiperdum TaxID=5694 RepID=A0A1G4IHB6_TRYEQ|nr:Trypanosome variant surface glycoprotein (A-type), putative [Trypanosoma equiperdum]
MTALILVCAVRTMLSAEAAKGAVRGEITKLVCGLATELRKAGTTGKSHISRLHNEADKLADLSRKMRALSGQRQGSMTIKESLLAGYVTVIQHRIREAEKAASIAATDLAEACSLQAGRLTEFLSVFAQAQGGTKHCVTKDGSAAVRTADEIPCLKPTGFTDAADITGEATAETLASAYTNFKKALDTHGQHQGTNLCNLVSAQTSGNYLDTEATTRPVMWGGKFFTTAASGADITAANWAANTEADITKSSFKRCHETLQTILSSGVDELTTSDNLAKILTKNAPGIAQVNIATGAIRKNVPSEEAKLTPAELTTLSNDIASLPKVTGADQLSDTEQDAKDVQEILEINETACKLGKTRTLETTDKTESNGKASKDKCSDKKGEACTGE